LVYEIQEEDLEKFFEDIEFVLSRLLLSDTFIAIFPASQFLENLMMETVEAASTVLHTLLSTEIVTRASAQWPKSWPRTT